MTTKELRQVAEVWPGKTPAKAAYESSGDAKIVKFRDVRDDGIVDWTNHEEGWINTQYVDTAQFVPLERDTILLTNAAHSLEHIGKKMAYIERLPHGVAQCFFVGELTAIRSNTEEVLNRWLYLYLQTNKARREIAKAAEGAHLVPRYLKRIPISYPDRRTQEEDLEVLDAHDAALFTARGELEAARRAKTALLQTLFSRGLPGRHTEFHDTKIGRLPAGWDVMPIQVALSEPPFNGVSPESRPEPPGTPILNVSCIKGGRCSTQAVTYVDVDEETIEECRARKGDFYVLRGNGNREYVASGGLLAVEPPDNCIFSDKLIRLRFNDRVVENFIPFLWLTSDFLTRLQSKAESGSGLWMMSKRDIRRQLFPCPPINEQREIVHLIRSSDDTILAIETKLRALERVKTSLLQNLLTGRLRIAD